MRTFGIAALLLLPAIPVPASSSPPRAPAVPCPGITDPVGRMHTAVLEGARVLTSSSTVIPPKAITGGRPPDPVDSPPIPPDDKIQPELKRRLDARSKGSVQVIVSFRDHLEIPRFPEPFPDEPPDSESNRAAEACAEDLIQDITADRAEDYRRLEERIRSELGGEVLRTYWLIRGLLARMPLSSVRELAAWGSVEYIELRLEGSPPPDQNPNNDVQDARKLIATDPYVTSGFGGVGRIALLDTGVRSTHVQFGSFQIILKGDCVNGDNLCKGPNVMPEDVCNHGTSSAAILAADAAQGNAYRGVTTGHIFSWKVFLPPSGATSGECFLDADAAVKGFQAAVAHMNRTVVAEMQANESYVGAIAKAANKAFDSGSVVVAANGNHGPNPMTTRSPAIAQRVIGVGAVNVETQAQYADQGRGATPDMRIKPDVQAPTDTETATAASDTALGAFGGTSGSTPYAGGAGGLLREWFVEEFGVWDPGQVYAQLILSGQNAYPFNNTSGAGLLRVPTKGYMIFGSVAISNGQSAVVKVDLSGGSVRDFSKFDAALWWPEKQTVGVIQHNHIELEIHDPNGVLRDESTDPASVFQRARTTSPIQPGVWRLRIEAVKAPHSPQVVYFTSLAWP